MRLKSNYELKKSEIKEYLTDTETIHMINFYWRYNEFGFPNSGGFAEQKNIHFEIIESLKKLDKIYNV